MRDLRINLSIIQCHLPVDSASVQIYHLSANYAHATLPDFLYVFSVVRHHLNGQKLFDYPLTAHRIFLRTVFLAPSPDSGYILFQYSGLLMFILLIMFSPSGEHIGMGLGFLNSLDLCLSSLSRE